MRISLKPMVEMSEEEKETLRAFDTELTKACDSINDCHNCQLENICMGSRFDDCCSDFINKIFNALGIYD